MKYIQLLQDFVVNHCENYFKIYKLIFTQVSKLVLNKFSFKQQFETLNKVIVDDVFQGSNLFIFNFVLCIGNSCCDWWISDRRQRSLWYLNIKKLGPRQQCLTTAVVRAPEIEKSTMIRLIIQIILLIIYYLTQLILFSDMVNISPIE